MLKCLGHASGSPMTLRLHLLLHHCYCRRNLSLVCLRQHKHMFDQSFFSSFSNVISLASHRERCRMKIYMSIQHYSCEQPVRNHLGIIERTPSCHLLWYELVKSVSADGHLACWLVCWTGFSSRSFLTNSQLLLPQKIGDLAEQANSLGRVLAQQ